MNLNLQQNNDKELDHLVSCPKGDQSCGYLTEILHLREEVSRLSEQVRTDALTGLYNFRFFTEGLAFEMERTRRSTQTMSLIILDVDHFKVFNDRWGHELGNKALVHIAQLINITIRKLDLACRFGGEEFVIILPDTELYQAINVAERLRESIASTPILIEGGDSVLITASMGVDSFTAKDTDSADGLLQRTDVWLYRAKHNGRNCLAHPTPEDTPSPKVSVTHEEKAALFGSDNS